MSEDLTASARVTVAAPPEDVWVALTDPTLIKQYMMGTDVVADWKAGGTILWRGEFNGKQFEDKGEVLEVDPPRLLKVTHYSPLSGQPDEPENYHTVLYALEPTDDGNGTQLVLNQDGSGSAEEAEHSSANWQMMLDGLKRVVESSDR